MTVGRRWDYNIKCHFPTYDKSDVAHFTAQYFNTNVKFLTVILNYMHTDVILSGRPHNATVFTMVY